LYNSHLQLFTNPLSLIHNAGTIRVLICFNSMQGAQRVVWRFWSILDVKDGYFPVFPFIFIHRAEEIEDSNLAYLHLFNRMYSFSG